MIPLSEVGTGVKKKIEERGLDVVLEFFYKPLKEMVAMTKAKREGICDMVICEGSSRFEPRHLEACVQAVADAMPEGDQKNEVLADLTFWRENIAQIMADYHLTPCD